MLHLECLVAARRRPVARLSSLPTLAASLALAVSVGGFLAGTAGAVEIPVLNPGSHVVVAGTGISCSLTSTSVTCIKTGGLAATINKTGIVHVTHGSRTLFAAGKTITIHNNGGFETANASIYCHAYNSGGLTLLCSDVEPEGGIPNTHGFEMSHDQVVVFRYDATRTLRVLRTFTQT